MTDPRVYDHPQPRARHDGDNLMTIRPAPGSVERLKAEAKLAEVEHREAALRARIEELEDDAVRAKDAAEAKLAAAESREARLRETLAHARRAVDDVARIRAAAASEMAARLLEAMTILDDGLKETGGVH